MTTKKANRAAYDAVKDMKRGLHIAMDHLITQGDKGKAEEILRELDVHITNWVNSTKVE